jgi:hypothetical protein
MDGNVKSKADEREWSCELSMEIIGAFLERRVMTWCLIDHHFLVGHQADLPDLILALVMCMLTVGSGKLRTTASFWLIVLFH